MRSWLSGSYEMLPVTSAFSSPPMRCARPGVPGSAHGRASVSGSRRYGWKVSPSFGAVANSVAIDGSCDDVRDQPRLRAVRERGVREQVDRRAVLERDPGRLDHGVEALRRARGGDHRDGALAVAAEEHHQQVGLLGLRRHAGRGAGALDVEDQERQLEHHAETDHLGLEHDSRPGRGRDAERAAERRAERGAAGGDLVLCLEGRDAEVLVPRELLENRRRRRDRVGAEEERQAGELRGGDQPVARRRVARDLPVAARRQLRRARPRTRRRSPRTSRRSCSPP